MTSEQEQQAPEEIVDMRGLSRCHQNFGWHVYMAGPCFDTREQALKYRDELDKEGVVWKPQR